LYNWTIGNVIEIFYQDRLVGPNDKQHYHLLVYVVVDIPHLKLPVNIEPWDKLHTSVSIQFIHNVFIMSGMIHHLQTNLPQRCGSIHNDHDTKSKQEMDETEDSPLSNTGMQS
jgi:hypothetical protein